MTLEVDTPLTSLSWKRDGADLSFDNQKSIDLGSVTSSDAGIYECFQAETRKEGTQAIMRLIVRGKKLTADFRFPKPFSVTLKGLLPHYELGRETPM